MPRSAAAVAAALTLVVLPATAASAHVRVVPEQTAAGGFTVLTFRVPNESADAAGQFQEFELSARRQRADA